ncbi:MAG: alpha/beta hydrolase [Verrucomicrobia bacterium]|nr:alpha/beta hydrolase [Verrucomicrobiota bacterium]
MSIQGRASPTVIFDTVGFAYLEVWNPVQPQVSQFAKTVSFDHGGHWGSAPGPKPRDARQLALELSAALRHAGITPPFVLVGYSMGGIYARVFAGMFPEEVVGIAFVDPSVEEFMEWFAQKFPEMAHISETHRLAQDEWASQRLSVGQARRSQLPVIPLTLITATKPQDMLTQRVLPYWLETHRNWLRAYPQAKHIVTRNSGHEVVLSDPALIIDAVRAMVNEVSSTSIQSKSAESQISPFLRR